MQQSAIRKTLPGLQAGSGPSGGLLRAPQALIEGLIALQRRAEERAQLRRLTDHQLRDMGLTRAQAQEMAERTIWSRPV